MKYVAGNRAIENHVADGKRLLLFQMMGRGKPYRYLGEFVKQSSYPKPNSPATRGPARTAIVFRLEPVEQADFFTANRIAEPQAPYQPLANTVTKRVIEVRKSQALFRRRLLGVEKQCRLTGVQDLRFLRASHIKPWAACITGAERTDGHNGVLLTPQADLLFDRGWITFEDKGHLIVTGELPADVKKRLGLDLRSGRNCGTFNKQQMLYLEHHRTHIFGKKYRSEGNSAEELIENSIVA
ncbi:HNH endonuclease [Lysobacter sp. K5869]|nr:HNH endonuclease [Lysobacter sp. K5869]